jgi:hypothetical protein
VALYFFVRKEDAIFKAIGKTSREQEKSHLISNNINSKGNESSPQLFKCPVGNFLLAPSLRQGK